MLRRKIPGILEVKLFPCLLKRRKLRLRKKLPNSCKLLRLRNRMWKFKRGLSLNQHKMKKKTTKVSKMWKLPSSSK